MSGFSARRPLGKTGLQVSPLGIGGGGGIQADDLLYAFERGINYFFYSSDLHHFSYSQSAPALRNLCMRGSTTRDQVVLATVSYLDDPDKLLSVLFDQFSDLGIDYIDVFHWGWITNKCDVFALAQAAGALKDNGVLARAYRNFEAMMFEAKEVNEELLKRGVVRNIGMSFHSRQAALRALPDIDVMMIRYNITLTDVERIVFSHLSRNKACDPGIVAFNTAHNKLQSFTNPPSHYPKDLYIPSVPDLYRFALSNPWVDVVLTGVSTRQQIDQALDAMEQGPLGQEDYEFLREYGSIFADYAAFNSTGMPT